MNFSDQMKKNKGRVTHANIVKEFTALKSVRVKSWVLLKMEEEGHNFSKVVNELLEAKYK